MKGGGRVGKQGGGKGSRTLFVHTLIFLLVFLSKDISLTQYFLCVRLGGMCL